MMVDEAGEAVDAFVTRVAELKRRSMLEQAALLHDEVRKMKPEDKGRDRLTFLQRPYAERKAREAVAKAPVWFTAYLPSLLGPKPNSKPLRTLADPRLWECFRSLGIKALHTGPVMKSGGFADGSSAQAEKNTAFPSIDGWFDPIEMEIEEQFGSAADYDAMVRIAENCPPWVEELCTEPDAVVIGDIVPGHTGLGPDFHLAIEGVEHYPGLYVLTRIDRVISGDDLRCEHLEATVKTSLAVPFEGSAFSRYLTDEEIAGLVAAKIIPGSPQRSMGPQAKHGWSLTRPIRGVHDADEPEAEGGGTLRQWLYLHFFHPLQPTLNWFDPGYGAWRCVTGQLNFVMWKLRSSGVRLDANAFLGIEVKMGGTWSEAHPLSAMATNMLAWQARRLGGFSFQEMNMAVPDIANSGPFGPDLAYDFVSRPACEHALLTGNCALLTTMYAEMNHYGLDPVGLIHALQNHDEITYELVHFATRSAAEDRKRRRSERSFSQDDLVPDDLDRRLNREGSRNEAWKPQSRWGQLRKEMRDIALANDFNRESGNGLVTTLPGLVAAALGAKKLADAAPLKADIQRGHLLLAAFNALQPGVFALSGWDLVGALPVEEARLPEALLDAGRRYETRADREAGRHERDYRWVNRGCYKLISNFAGDGSVELKHPDERYGLFALPEAQALYGPVDKQNDPADFIPQLTCLLEARGLIGIATGSFAGTLDLRDPALFGMVTWLGSDALAQAERSAAVALFNFSRDTRTVSRPTSWATEWLTAQQSESEGNEPLLRRLGGTGIKAVLHCSGTGLVPQPEEPFSWAQPLTLSPWSFILLRIVPEQEQG
jgi:trehalose synthase